MTIVHVEDFVHPDAGYQLNVLPKYMVAMGHEVIIVTSEMEKMPSYLTDFFKTDNLSEKDTAFTEETGVKIIRVPIFTYYSGRSIYKPGLFKLLDSLNPDVLYVHGEDTYFGIRTIWRLSKFQYPVLFDDHMVDMASKNKLAPLFRWFYRNFVTPNVIKHKSIVIRTMDNDYIFRRFHIPRDQGPLIEFGSDLMKFHPDTEVGIAVRRELNIPSNHFVLLYAGKMDTGKGGQFLADSIREKLSSNRPVTFLIIGNHSGEYGQKVKQTFEQSENIIVSLPAQTYRDLSRYYQCADAAVFPKNCSLSYYDVQACGLPVLLENNPVCAKRVGHNNGFLFQSGNIEDFRKKMTDIANLDPAKLLEMKQASTQYIEEHYNYQKIAEKYMEIINMVVKRWDEHN